MMRVVMFVLNDMTADARVDREAVALGEAGHDVTVLAVRGEGLADAEVRRGYRVRRVVDATIAPSRAFVRKYLEQQARDRAFLRTALQERPDVIQSVDSDTLRPAAMAGELLGVPVVADQGELYPDMLVSNRARVPSAVLHRWRRIERRYLPRMHSVMTVGDAVAAELRKRYGVDSVVVRSVPRLEPVGDRMRLRDTLGIPEGRLIVLYQGLVNRGRGLEVLIDAVRHVPEADLVVQGFGPSIEEYLDRASQIGVADRVRYMGKMPADELTMWASGAGVGAVLIENLSLNNYLSAPNKLYQYLMAGIPILGSAFPEIGAVVDEGGCGIAVDPADTGAVVQALRGLVELGPDGRAAMGSRARELAETKYNWDIEKRSLLAVYERLSHR